MCVYVCGMLCVCVCVCECVCVYFLSPRNSLVHASNFISFLLYVQVFVHAIINSGPREDSTRVGAAGLVRCQAVDVSHFLRMCQVIYLIVHGVSAQLMSFLFCFCLFFFIVKSKLHRPVAWYS